ncbi:hypothetical protein [Actinomadura mexicana]|uniref:Uncharacterized protein n=1 Tax=Actinomadura mexicana TaxID=134959 RepID=A0A239H3R0_9ACTN|nr:hypothetical protein [Actinomadura mexicana]SNS76000.1 hypothetical protein SAMN06265355_12832 [Actinomadura mexicana]
MAEAGAEEFAEFGAAALDSFQALFEETEHLDHRSNDVHARELLGDLLIDLMHYAQRRGLEFNDVLAQANGHYLSERNSSDVYAIGSVVQLEGPAADEAALLGRPTRGGVTGIYVPHDGPTEYYVRFLGEPGSHSILATELAEASTFPDTSTTKGIISDPFLAEDALVEVMTRIGRADLHGIPPNQDDLNDRHALLEALVAWNGMDTRDVTDLLLAQVEQRLTTSQAEIPVTDKALSPGRLAAQDFPIPLEQGLTEHRPGTHTTPHPTTSASRRTDRHR